MGLCYGDRPLEVEATPVVPQGGEGPCFDSEETGDEESDSYGSSADNEFERNTEHRQSAVGRRKAQKALVGRAVSRVYLHGSA